MARDGGQQKTKPDNPFNIRELHPRRVLVTAGNKIPSRNETPEKKK